MSSESDASNPYRQAIVGMASFAATLIENGTRHNQNWRRATYLVPDERVAPMYEALLQGQLGRLLFRPGEIIPQHDVETGLSAAEYAQYELDESGLIPGTELLVAGVPRRIELVIDEHKAGKDDAKPKLNFGLMLVHDEVRNAESLLEDLTTVNLRHEVGKMTVSRHVFKYLLFETGYEGHAFQIENVEPETLIGFLSLLKANVGRLLPELTYEEERKIVEYKCVHTGKVFRYDPERDTHVAEDGTALESYTSPLYGLEEQFIDPENPPVIREVNSVLRYIPKNNWPK